MTHSKPLACNEYPWGTFYQRQGRAFHDDLDRAMQEIKQSSFDSIEPLLKSPDQLEQVAAAAEKAGLAMRSVYVNSVLHERSQAAKSIEEALALARLAKQRMGAEIVVTNPSPIRWGGAEDKSDDQLITQAEALDKLGRLLRQEGLTLAYHNHDPELRQGAREFHHMLVSTDPDNVKFCLDAHWIYRGAGNSSVALFDAIELYGQRIVELHLRQSRDGVWTEAFGEGDIDYPRLADWLLAHDIHPLITLEQAVEKNSPNTMNSLEAHTLSAAAVRQQFAPFL